MGGGEWEEEEREGCCCCWSQKEEDDASEGEGVVTARTKETNFTMSRGPLTDSSGNVLGLCALARLTTGGIRNYTVSTDVCQRFVDGLHRRKTGEKEGVAVTLVVKYRVVLFKELMNTGKQVDYVLRYVGGGGYKAI